MYVYMIQVTSQKLDRRVIISYIYIYIYLIYLLFI